MNNVTGKGIRMNRNNEVALRDGLTAIFNWIVWGFMTLLVSSQFLGIVWNSTSYDEYAIYGRSPINPLSEIAGTNDEPYSDRNIVCMAQGRSYIPMQLSKVLGDPKLSTIVDVSGKSINGYRVCKREEVDLDPQAYEQYIHVCERIDYTLGMIQDSCDALGFNVTRDVLRIVDDIDSNTTREIPRALPILIMPFWDSATYAHYAIPGWDGQACVFRLDGMYLFLDEPNGVLRATPRGIREAKTAEWLHAPGGIWRNGWYEDTVGKRWHADMMTTDLKNPYGLISRQFDMLSKTELNCSSTESPRLCLDFPLVDTWGRQSKSIDEILSYNAVYISNGTHYGLFIYEGLQRRIIENKYSLETFISNVSIFVLLFRWFVSMAAMLNSYRRGVAPWQTTGIGCLSSSRTFNVLPIVLLPHLKMTIAAFWCVGCAFEGQQRALAEAWFAVYPAIIEFSLLYFSILNGIAKICHRRMSDSLFGPTIIVFGIFHYIRDTIVTSGWTRFDGRIPTAIMSDEFDRLTLLYLFKPDVALRMNGNVPGFLYFKIVVLTINLIPLVLSENMSRSGDKFKAHSPCHIEKTLALQASNIGGLGLSPVYALRLSSNSGPKTHALIAQRPPGFFLLRGSASRIRSRPTVEPLSEGPSNDGLSPVLPFNATTRPDTATTEGAHNETSPTLIRKQRHELIAYEINRLGYLVFGGKYLITYDDWYILTSMAPLRIVEKLWNHRISVFDVIQEDDGYYASQYARLCRLDDEGLRSVPVTDVTLCAFR